MNNKEAEKVLEELQGVRPENLTGEAKRLFEAIMKIADTKDNLYKENLRLKMEIDKYKKKYEEKKEEVRKILFENNLIG